MVYYARKVKQNLRDFSAHLGAPAMGAVAQATEGSLGGRECQWVKEKAGYRTPLSLRGQFANWPWQSVSLLDSSMFQYGVKEERIPTSLRSSE